MITITQQNTIPAITFPTINVSKIMKHYLEKAVNKTRKNKYIGAFISVLTAPVE